jgi:hypothetical protein
MTGAIKNISGTTTMMGSVTKTVKTEDPGATAWFIDAVANDSSDVLEIDVRGATGKTIEWKTTVKTTITTF